MAEASRMKYHETENKPDRLAEADIKSDFIINHTRFN